MPPLTTVNCPHVPIVSVDHCGSYEACVHGESENGGTPTHGGIGVLINLASLCNQVYLDNSVWE